MKLSQDDFIPYYDLVPGGLILFNRMFKHEWNSQEDAIAVAKYMAMFGIDIMKSEGENK